MKLNMISTILLLGATAITAGNSVINETSLEEVKANMSDRIGAEGTEGELNTYYGFDAGLADGGAFNSFFGIAAGTGASSEFNTFIGTASGVSNTIGGDNTFLGSLTGAENVSGARNVFIGVASGYFNKGSDNVFIGFESGFDSGDTNNTLVIENSRSDTPLIYGEFDNDLVKINGSFVVDGTVTATDVMNASHHINDTANTRNLLALDVNNTGDGASDVGFSLENKETHFKWTFRTFNPTEGFAASKIGTGGTEFEVGNTGTDLSTTTVKMGGVTVFESGHLVTASSRSLKDEIEPLDTEAALEAFDKLQPVSYVYKSHKGEKVVGFIAEDVPDLVSMPSKKSIDSTEIVAVLTSVLAETRANAEAMKTKMEVMEANAEAMRTEIAELKGMK